MKKPLLIIALALIVLVVQAQSYDDDALAGQFVEYTPQKAGYFSIRQSFQPQDYLLGMEIGLANLSKDILFYGSFDARPFKKRVQEQIASNLYHQYSETRFVLGVGAEWQKYFGGKSGLFVNGTIGYSWGDFKGTDRSARRGLTTIPRVGYIYKTNSSVWFKMGYEYQDIYNELSGNHRLFLGINIVLD